MTLNTFNLGSLGIIKKIIKIYRLDLIFAGLPDAGSLLRELREVAARDDPHPRLAYVRGSAGPGILALLEEKLRFGPPVLDG